MGAPGGVEPPTNGLGNRCSIQLSYGAACRNRWDYFSLQHSILAKRQGLLPIRCQILGQLLVPVSAAEDLLPTLRPRASQSIVALKTANLCPLDRVVTLR